MGGRKRHSGVFWGLCFWAVLTTRRRRAEMRDQQPGDGINGLGLQVARAGDGK